ncbi:hypothetical protein J2752_001027 [Halarchaeum rubridurum]|uniref:Uncharacterized protein n=1 Tax=Halarchaeum rubridurum TaxID=489911 RepID=A0A830FL34_9EURY|nr:DUF5787 family protein [Halarchaeum rubridurum]MBP1954146.1 hypothetical protein [Halarchaeum rubridurum]GGM57722.1 hypothetical protein GCM10009017_04830 [Halarchaeum rubridurum]
MREFAFELRLCARLEREYPVVARQLGTSVRAAAGRIVDVVCLTRGPEFDARTRLTPDAIPAAAIKADVGVGRWRRVTDAVDAPPARARDIAERGRDAGFFELDRRDGHAVVRRTARYPDWVGDLVGIENKPDLGEPGNLAAQLRHDVSLGVLDFSILATESYVTRAHLNRLPPAVGVWRVDVDAAEPITVVREPTRLDADGWGLEPGDAHPGRREIASVSPAAKATQRRRVAERAYGKGWRTYDLPACANAERGREAGATTLPFCAYEGRLVDPAAECGPDCPGHDPADPPAVDPEGERAARQAWDPDAASARTQAGLGRWTSE